MEKSIEQGFFELLQSDIILTIEGKKFKAGRFLNFKIKEFYIQLDLVVNDKYRKVDIPLPFKVRSTDGGIVFSYRLEDIGSFGLGVKTKFQNTIGGGKSKLYDKELIIRRVIND